jgi:hypothetical protein
MVEAIGQLICLPWPPPFGAALASGAVATPAVLKFVASEAPQVDLLCRSREMPDKLVCDATSGGPYGRGIEGTLNEVGPLHVA